MIGFDVETDLTYPEDAFKDTYDRACKAVADLRKADGESMAMDVLSHAVYFVHHNDPHTLEIISDRIATTMRDAQRDRDKRAFDPAGDGTWAKRGGKWMYVGD